MLATQLTAQPVITVQPTNQVVWANSTNIVISVSATGVGPLTYRWFLNGTNVPNDLITTLAGNGQFGSSGDGGAATNAQLSNPYGVAADSRGNVYIGDSSARVRKVDTNGIITTFAGTNSGGFSGDGGPAKNAKIGGLSGITADAWGNIYLADVGNNARIRNVNTNGIIMTVAGNGTSGYSGDGGPATNAEIKYWVGLPYGMCVDAPGNLYLADTGNYCVRKIDTNGIISTVPGSSSYGMVYAVIADKMGNIYVSGTGRVFKLDTNSVVTTVAGGGSSVQNGIMATNAQISPFGLWLDTNGNLFIGDLATSWRTVHKVDTNGILTIVVGTGVAGNSGDGGAATAARISHPFGIAGDAFGNLLIADEVANRIRKVAFNALPRVTLTNLFPSSAGNYQVIVTDSTGSVTSNISNLSIAYPPILGLRDNFANRFLIGWPAFQPSVFQVQWTTNLAGGTWSNLGSTITNTGTTIKTIYQSDYSWTNYPQGFYRVAWLQ